MDDRAESKSLGPQKNDEIAEELADVFLYLVQIADKLEIDLLAAAKAKLEKNARKYPVARSRGSSRKYNELGPAEEGKKE